MPTIARPLLALLLAAPVPARAAVPQPPKGTWSFGVTGIDSANIAGNPNVRYVATDKTTLELTPTLAWSGLTQGLALSNSQSYGLTLDVIHKIGTYKDTNLSWLVQPSVAYKYTKLIDGATNKSPQPGFGIGAGFELEHFFQPNLSVSARALLDFHYTSQNSYSDIAPGTTRGSAKTFAVAGQALAMHYYFTDDWKKVEASPEERGRWAVGWRGLGFWEGYAQPSVKYVLNDRWAIEAMPAYTLSHTNSGAGYTHSENFFLPVDFERTLARGHGVQLTWLIEPAVGAFISDYKFSDSSYLLSRTYDVYLNAGLEFEYFLLDDLSVGARGLLTYRNGHGPVYTPVGYAGQRINNSVSLVGQVLSVRWYFGHPAGK